MLAMPASVGRGRQGSVLKLSREVASLLVQIRDCDCSTCHRHGHCLLLTRCNSSQNNISLLLKTLVWQSLGLPCGLILPALRERIACFVLPPWGRDGNEHASASILLGKGLSGKQVLPSGRKEATVYLALQFKVLRYYS